MSAGDSPMLPPLVVPRLPAKAQEKLPTAACRSVVLSKPVTRPKLSMIGTGMTVPSFFGNDDCVTVLRPTLTSLAPLLPSPLVTTSVLVASGTTAKLTTTPVGLARSGPLSPVRMSVLSFRVSGSPSPSASDKPDASSQTVPFQRQRRSESSTNRSSPIATSVVSSAARAASFATASILATALPRM